MNKEHYKSDGMEGLFFAVLSALFAATGIGFVLFACVCLFCFALPAGLALLFGIAFGLAARLQAIDKESMLFVSILAVIGMFSSATGLLVLIIRNIAERSVL